jgi:hypothetical protein
MVFFYIKTSKGQWKFWKKVAIGQVKVNEIQINKVYFLTKGIQPSKYFHFK